MMKKTVVTITCLLFAILTFAQLKQSNICPTFHVDVLYGKLNEGINSQSTPGEIKKTFPCFTEIHELGSSSKCAGIFYKDKDIYFYTDRDYIEIRQNFKGKLTLPLMGASRKSLFKFLGNPVMKDINWEAYRLGYGILVLYYSKTGKVNKLQISSKGTETLKLCD